MDNLADLESTEIYNLKTQQLKLRIHWIVFFFFNSLDWAKNTVSELEDR